MIGVCHANNLQETKIETLETKTNKLETDETGNTLINSNLLINSPQQTTDLCEPNKITVEGNIVAKHLQGLSIFRPSMDYGEGHANSGERITCAIGKNSDKALWQTFGITSHDDGATKLDFTRFDLISNDHTYRGRSSPTSEYKCEMALYPFGPWFTKKPLFCGFSGE